MSAEERISYFDEFADETLAFSEFFTMDAFCDRSMNLFVDTHFFARCYNGVIFGEVFLAPLTSWESFKSMSALRKMEQQMMKISDAVLIR